MESQGSAVTRERGSISKETVSKLFLNRYTRSTKALTNFLHERHELLLRAQWDDEYLGGRDERREGEDLEIRMALTCVFITGSV